MKPIEALHYERHVSLRLCDGDAGLESRDGIVVRITPIRSLFQREGEWYPEISAIGACRIKRQVAASGGTEPPPA